MEDRNRNGRAIQNARMRAILNLASEGLTDKAIAERLSLSPHTIDYYWRRIRAELGAASRTEAVASILGHPNTDVSPLRLLQSWPGI